MRQPPSEGNGAAGARRFPQAGRPVSSSPKNFCQELVCFAAVWGLDLDWIFFFLSFNFMLLLAGEWLHFFLECDSLLRCVLGWEQEGPIIAGLYR